MSIKIMSAVWEHAPQKGAELIVLLALADWANDRGECDPSYSQLATKARVDRRRAIRLVSKLIADKALTVDEGQGFCFGKQGASNRITVVAPVPPSGTGATGGSGTGATGGSGTGATGGSGTGATHNGQQQRSTTTVNNKTPQPPTLPAGQPGDQDAARSVPTRATGSTSKASAPRSTRSPRASSPEGGSEGRGGRWHGVATAIMAAIGRPAPAGKLPSWLGNTVAAFGAAAGDDPAVAASLVLTWGRSTALRQAMEGGYLRDHTVPSLAGQWIATTGKRYGAVAPAGADPEADRMKAVGAPENWRDLVYAPGGVKRAPQLALPRMGLEPYTRPADWPAWYRAFEGVDA